MYIFPLLENIFSGRKSDSHSLKKYEIVQRRFSKKESNFITKPFELCFKDNISKIIVGVVDVKRSKIRLKSEN